jgi:hypothetical protein
MQSFGGVELSVDGRSVDLSKTLAYKGVMVSDVPNLASVFGYINASWTLKADLICAYVCRLLNFMDRKGVRQVTPNHGTEPAAAPFVENFSSGYMQRALQNWPKQGSKSPWRVYQNYFRDAFTLKMSSFNDGALRFSNPPAALSAPTKQELATTAK